MAVGSDRTNTNTGKVGGVIRLLENRLSRPLQWIICLLHANELPLRHFFTYLNALLQDLNHLLVKLVKH